MTAPDKPKLGWLARRRANRDERKRREADGAYRGVAEKVRGGRGGAADAGAGHGGEGGMGGMGSMGGL
jgi:hypothetical protein